MVRKITVPINEEQLHEDLEKYRLKAIELGATDAKIITTDTVVIDERVRMKCIYPKCPLYGTNAHCPPHGIELDFTRKIVNNFRYAIFTRLEGESKEFAGPEAAEKGLLKKGHIQTFKIVGTIESAAFFDGYHLAVGFACGPCKLLFCPEKECSALQGKGCRQGLKARGSMEGAGIDAFTMASKVGWEVYPIGPSISPEDVPFGATYGLVLIH